MLEIDFVFATFFAADGNELVRLLLRLCFLVLMCNLGIMKKILKN
jgi:hypothetical protein